MFPLTHIPSILFKYRKWIVYGVAVLAVLILAWRIAAWRDGYLKLGQAQEALRNEQQARANDRKTYTENILIAEKEAQALAHDLGEIRSKFANMATPLPKTLIRTVEVPREIPVTSCPEPRVSPEFVRVWNDAGKP